MSFDYNRLFLAEVVNVKLVKSGLNKQDSSMKFDYALDIKSTLEPNVVKSNIRFMAANLGGSKNGSITINPPAIGDYVVCANLLAEATMPIAIGVISNPGRNSLPIGLIKGDGTYLVYHESGTWIRIRNKKNEWNSDMTNVGRNLTSVSNDSEMIIHHNDGHEITLNADEIDIKHKNGTGVVMDSSGGVTIFSDNIKLSSDATTQKAVLGDLLKTWLDTHTHTGNLGYPTSQPNTPLPDSTLSKKITLA